jgi:hypothetical protein
MVDSDHKNFKFLIFFFNLLIQNLGLDPHLDRIRIQQQPGSASGFSKIPGIRIRNTETWIGCR